MPRATSISCTCAALFMAAAAPIQALANTWDIRSRTIPASACQVRDAGQAAMVEMEQGAWRFAGMNTGRVTLTCPFPISRFPADHAQFVPPYTQMSFYRVWYRDSDAATNGASVRVIPYVRLAPAGAWSNIGLVPGGGGLIPVGVCQFSSNAHPDMGFAVNIRDCSHTVQYNALYSFEVTLSRNSTTLVVEFHGIDFHDGTTPTG